MFDLKNARIKKKISQHELSKLSGVSRYNITLHESGYRTLSEDERRDIKAVLAIYKKGASHVTDEKK